MRKVTGCWAFVSALALVGACGGGSTQRADRSTTGTAAARRPPGSLLPANAEIERAAARGAIESITPEETVPGYPMLRVVIAGEAPVAERSFLVALPDGIALPFAVGDPIVLTIETVPGPPTWQPQNIVVTTDAGELLAMHGVSAPPGWAFERAGEVRRVDRGDYDEVEMYVAFSHGGQRVVTEGGQWSRLASPDGAWWVAGSASDVDGDERPPDSGASWSMMIVRAR